VVDVELSARESMARERSLMALRRLVRKNFLLLVGTLIVIFALILALNALFGRQVQELASWLADTFGISGIIALIFVSDAIVSPIPPEAAFLVILKSDLSERAWLYVTLLGCASIAAGQVAWLGGRLVGGTRAARWVLVKVYRRHRGLVMTYGHIAVVLGALTPLPYSAICWSAGMLRVGWLRFTLATTLRLPRFLVYFFVIAQAEALS
jgi:membrane protein YqaA with SNARE-associated domain